jgi:hypothetical protein
VRTGRGDEKRTLGRRLAADVDEIQLARAT